MIIFKIYKKLFLKNKFFVFNYNHNSFFEGVYRLLAIIISPLFIKLNPNLISFFSLFLGFVAFYLNLFYFFEVQIVLILILMSFVLDFIDGIVARYNNLSTFFGRFIDGLFDIIVLGLIHIILFIEIRRNFNFESEINSVPYLITIFVLPIQHLILDRYSALARWSNEIQKFSFIKPYVRNSFLNKITMTLFDLKHLCIFFLIFNKSNLDILINLFFLVSFLNSFFVILLYFFLSKKHLSLINNQKDNNE